MIKYGRGIRWFNDYDCEVRFSVMNNFDFMQVWFMKGELILDKVPTPKEQQLLNSEYPVIIHAVYDIDDYDKYNGELIRILKFLGHKEVIIHPVCEATPVKPETIHILAENLYKTNELLKAEDIKLYVENNSVIDKFFHKPNEIKIVFDRNPDIELLLDLAHIDDYNHLGEILEIKFPKCLHIADKRFSVEHEHLPIGHGELDFELIFNSYLKGYDGKVIFEVVDTDEEIIKSRNTIKSILDAK